MTQPQKRTSLCWGQRYIWLRHQQLPAAARHEANIVIAFELPGDTPVPGLRASLNYLVRRHEALRTTYHCDAAGDPYQCVHPPAALPLEVVTSERDGTASPAETMQRLAGEGFDLTAEWPVRACLITTGGRPRRLVVVLNHMAFDAWTVDRLERELEALGAGVAARRPATLAPIRHQPFDLSRYEATAGAVAEKDRSLAYWRDEITRLPADMIAARRRPAAGVPAFAASLTSPALLAASHRLAARHRVWPSVVHLAVNAVVTAAYAGVDHVGHLAFSGNRGTNDFGDVMTCMFSPVLVRLSCPSAMSFAELEGQVSARFEAGLQAAYVPYDEFLELAARDGHRRGEQVRIGSEVNFLSHPAHRTRARRTQLAWNATPESWSAYGGDSYLRIYEMQDAVVLAMDASARTMDAAAVEAFLRGYEAVLLAAAEDDLRPVSELIALTGFGTPALRDASADVPVAPRADAAAEAVTVLAEVVREVNALNAVNLSLPYVVAGGRVLRIPRVLARLRERGWAGAGVSDLTGTRRLDEVAATLHPVTEPASSAAAV